MPEVVATFSLNESQWQRIKKAANVYSLPDLVLTGHDTEIRLTAKDKKNDTSNTYSLLVGEGVDVVDFEYSFKMENIRIIDGSYRVEVTGNLISKWTSNSDDLVYYIAMEPDQV